MRLTWASKWLHFCLNNFLSVSDSSILPPTPCYVGGGLFYQVLYPMHAGANI
jgi:hypothetical protein